ncbi:glycosyltransferase family 2 protein [Ruegeria arenilitoris]|uniref:glycosyltransferase family 2 protein n=1 Tax=Ruegeria arenilitoris TaxID=1173585 RepID=UPI00147B1964|nr:glycosyltransferase family 2 protein [Ruegeria arenilitoris]
MGTLPHVSVIIPCRDREDTVIEAVTSVLGQDYPLLNVVAVDDGSTDGTRAALDSIEDDRLCVLSNPGPRGPSATRNYGVKHTDSEWIAFQDSDDLWLPTRLSEQMPQLSSGAFVAGYCGMLVKSDTSPDSPATDRFPRPGTPPLSGNILVSLLHSSFISTQMLIVRRDIFDRVGGFDESLNALVDWELMLRIAQEGPIDYIDSDLVVQRMSANSITHSNPKRVASQQRILELHYDLFSREPAALAKHHHRIAGGLRSLGNWSEARAHSAQAIRMGAAHPRYLLGWLRCATRTGL